ncbi:sister chromatid cohesion protein PDS5 homolog D-like isoform X2 [Euphorbia lathyris]
MKDALLPPMKALISDALLRNSDVDVKVSVASCLSEITRITAPNAPYSDDHMKEIFQLIVESMEKLSHVSSRSCTKAVSILETIAKVRLCLVMLDLELDELIMKMFQHFLQIIRSNHSHTVFLAMETIMTLIIDESDNISMGLLTSLLASVRKDNQSVSPIAWKLGEKVITNCAAKIKPYLKEVLQSENIAKDDYASVVASLYGDKSHNFEHDRSNGSGDHLVTERLSSAASPGEVFQAVDGISNSLSNTSGSTRDVANNIQNNSSKILEHCSVIQKSENTDAIGTADPAINLEREPGTIPQKRGRKPNSLMNPEEGYDHSWISKGRKTAKLSSGRKSRNKGIDVQSENIVTKKESLSLAHVTELVELMPKTDGVSGESQPKGQPKRTSTDTSSLRLDEEEALNTEHEKTPSEDEVNLRKLSEGRSNEEIKQDKRSRKIQCAAKTSEEISLPSEYLSDGKAQFLRGLEGKPLLKSAKRGLTNINTDVSLAQTDIRKTKVARGISDVDVTEASSVRKIKSFDRDGSSKKEISKTNLKKKRTPRKEVLPPARDIGPELVGSRVRIWWPLDSTFYKAVVESYDHIKKKHRVLYADGDEEILNLKKERWELIGDDILCDKEEVKADSSSDKPKKAKGTVKSVLAQQLKVDAKRSGSTSISKRKARKSDSKYSGSSTGVVDKTRNDWAKPGTNLEGGSKLKIKSGVITEQITPENSSCSDEANSKGSNECCDVVKPSRSEEEKEVRF